MNHLLTPSQIAANPGLNFVLQSLSKQLAPTPKKPKAVVTDPEQGEPARCYTCQGIESDGCVTCLGTGTLPELRSVDMVVWRDFDEVPVQVSLNDKGEVIDAWVVATIGDKGEVPRWSNGSSITLTPDEQELASKTFKEVWEKPEPQGANHDSRTEETAN